MADLSIRNLDDRVRERLRVQAASHGRSMESEVRSILEEAVGGLGESHGLVAALRDRFTAIGGVELDAPARSTPARSADFSS